jgi:hypothetical protein
MVFRKDKLIVAVAAAMVVIVVLFIAVVATAQDERIDYCKYPDGEIVTIAKGSPCPDGSYPL